MPIKQSINNVEVFFIKKGDKYIVIHGTEEYITKEKPVTDQDVEKIERELEKVKRDKEIVENLINYFQML